jgi:hypothetical protein
MIKARVLEDFMSGHIRVLLHDPETQMVFGRDQIFGPGDVAPNAQLPDEAFLLNINRQYVDLVLAALNEHFAGEKAPGDAYALRRDLEHEKDRTDKLLDFVLEIARQEPTERIIQA